MTIPTPTSEPQLPQGLPDPALIARMAGEFFAALPGGAPGPLAGGANAPTHPLPRELPSPPSGPGGAGSPVLSAAPAVRPPQDFGPDGALPSLHALAPASASAPAPGPRAGGLASGVPGAYAAALPQAPVAANGAPFSGTPGAAYYFAAEAGRIAPAAAPHAGHPHEDRVQPQTFGLPGAAELRALLADTGRAPASGTGYYFADGAGGSYAERARHEGVPQAAAPTRPAFDVQSVRRDFPILSERVHGRPLIWFDNAATTHKPRAVIERLVHFYEHENSNIHRAAHELAARSTDAYEGARRTVQRFIGAGSPDEIVFVRGATEAINLVAKTWGAKHVGEGDEILVSHLEHHANIVPWQQLAAARGARLRVIPVDDSGQVLLHEVPRLLSPRTRLIAVTQVSNALGTVVPVREIAEMAHRAGAKVLVDGAQSVSHMRVDVQALGADFFVFSGHKVFAPTGIGVVWGRAELLEDMPPWQGGGNMIADVTFERTLYHPAPNKFEAGTGNIADAVGLGAALDYVERIGLENIARYEHELVEHATQGLSSIPGLRLIGTARDKASVVSFVLQGYTTEEVGRALDREGIAVRSGHHCAQPILRRFGVEATVRPSLAFYNTFEEIDCLVAVVNRLARAGR